MSSAVRTLFSRKRRTEEESGKREFRPLSGSRGASDKRAAVARATASEQKPGKPRYRVDLSSQQADCEANYARLRRILPELDERDEWLFHMGSGAVKAQMCVSVVDRAPYTTTLELSQPQNSASATMKAPRLTVCMYHDADMAEVVAWENHRRLRPRYDYPNRQMYQNDEKAQLNRFLADWLTLCQAQGRVTFDLSEIGLYK